MDKKGQPYPVGTAFFVGVKNANNQDIYHGYLVTAKHVLQNDQGEFHSTFYARLNRLDGTSGFVQYQISDGTIFVHQDSDVDIAVIPWVPDQKIFDIIFIPDELIASPDIIRAHDIGEGDDVFFSGLFTSHIGQKRNQPILRYGKIALMDDEKIEWKEKGKPPKFLDLYLMECQSFGGNSGSPVFLNLSPMRRPGQITFGLGPMLLAGIMKGTFTSANELEMLDTVNQVFSRENVGIAAVIPAYKLQELLFSEKVTQLRKTPPTS